MRSWNNRFGILAVCFSALALVVALGGRGPHGLFDSHGKAGERRLGRLRWLQYRLSLRLPNLNGMVTGSTRRISARASSGMRMADSGLSTDTVAPASSPHSSRLATCSAWRQHW